MQKDGNVLMKTKLQIKNEQAVIKVGLNRGNGGCLIGKNSKTTTQQTS